MYMLARVNLLQPYGSSIDNHQPHAQTKSHDLSSLTDILLGYVSSNFQNHVKVASQALNSVI